jgi:cell filamentation protein
MDPYVYPRTNVLRNLREIRDADVLNTVEAIATTRRLTELENKPLHGRFDTHHFQAIHRYIFQDMYAWAGELRTVNISKSGDTFAFVEHIASSLARTFWDLQGEGLLTGLDMRRFSNRAAYYLGEINAVHPFREGNGRAQREFIRQLGVHNGWVFDWTGISQEQMVDASIRSLRVDNRGLEDLLTRALRAR